jgi:hypothetical protein
MAIQRYRETQIDEIGEGVERRLGYTGQLMMAVLDFNNGPQSEPDPPQYHPHEQVS